MDDRYLARRGALPDDIVRLFEPFRRQGHDLPPLPVEGQPVDMLPLEEVHDLLYEHREMIEGEVVIGLVLETVLAVGIASQGGEQDD